MIHYHGITPEYIAGFFDGEGSINAFVTSRDVRTIGLQVRLCQRQRDDLPLRWCHERYGGWLHTNWRRGDSTRAPVTQWVIRGLPIVSFLTDIEPFAIVKQPQISVGLMFMTTHGQHGRKLDANALYLRALCRRELLRLNRRGPNYA